MAANSVVAKLWRFAQEHERRNNKHTHTWFADEYVKPLHIPEKDVATLQKLLFRFAQNKSDQKLSKGPNSFTEKVTVGEPFRFFVDLDFQFDDIKHMPIAELRTLMKELISMFIDFVSAACKCADPLKYIVASRNMYKFHLHFPTIVVTSQTAEALIARFDVIFKEHKLYNPKVFDTSVYRTGLRMLWCHKGLMDDKRKTNLSEMIKEHEAHFGEGTYKNVYSLVDNDTFEEIDKHIEHLIDTSIFPQPNQQVTVIELDSPKDNVFTGNTKPINEPKRSLPGSSDVKQVRMPLLKTFAEKHYNVKLSAKAKAFKDTECIIWGTTYNPTCPFKKDKHKSNNLYLVIDKSGMRMKCHDEQCKDKVHGNLSKTAFSAEVLGELEQVWERSVQQKVEAVSAQLQRLQKDYPNNKFEIDYDQISIIDEVAKIGLKDLYCIKCKRFHDDPQTFLECYATAKVFFSCVSNTFGAEHLLMLMPTGVTNNLFQLNQFNTTINNYGTEVKEPRDFGPYGNFPKLYSDDTINHLCFRSLSGDTYRVAEFLARIAEDRYLYIDRWYTYNGKYWEPAESVEGFMGSEIPKLYESITSHFSDPLHVKWIHELSKDLENYKSRRQYVDEFRVYMAERCKLQKIVLDGHPHLITFQNGTYDTEQCIFREHAREDYVSQVMSYELPVMSNAEIRRGLVQFFESILPDVDVRRFLLLYLALHLQGRNKHCIVCIFTGTGGNGKGLVKFLMKKAFEHMHVEPSATFLTSDRPSDEKPCPNMVNLRLKRSVFASEPESSKQINGGFLKFLSGNDEVRVRNCHANEFVEFVPRFLVTLLCNAIPSIQGGAEDVSGIWRRVKIVHFPIEFVDGEPLHEFQRKSDTSLMEKMATWGPEMMLMLIEIFSEYRKSGGVLEVPPAVVEQVEQQKSTNNPIRLFVQETLEKDVNGRVHTHRIATLYNSWLRDRAMNLQVDTKNVKSLLAAARFTVRENTKVVECVDASNNRCKSVSTALMGWKERRE